jgi:hypothetical protein
MQQALFGGGCFCVNFLINTWYAFRALPEQALNILHEVSDY